MDHELKIVMKYSDDKSIASHNVKIMIDDVVIGMIQNIKFEASAKNFIAKLAVTFPDSSDWDILGSEEYIFDKMEENADQFRKILGAEVNYSKG